MYFLSEEMNYKIVKHSRTMLNISVAFYCVYVIKVKTEIRMILFFSFSLETVIKKSEFQQRKILLSLYI